MSKAVEEKRQEVAVYALFREGKVVGAPFFATEASLYPYVDQMLGALPFGYCVQAFRRSWSEVVGNIKKMAVFDPETGKFENLDEPVFSSLHSSGNSSFLIFDQQSEKPFHWSKSDQSIITGSSKFSNLPVSGSKTAIFLIFPTTSDHERRKA